MYLTYRKKSRASPNFQESNRGRVVGNDGAVLQHPALHLDSWEVARRSRGGKKRGDQLGIGAGGVQALLARGVSVVAEEVRRKLVSGDVSSHEGHQRNRVHCNGRLHGQRAQIPQQNYLQLFVVIVTLL